MRNKTTSFVLWTALACLWCAGMAAARVEPKSGEKPSLPIANIPPIANIQQIPAAYVPIINALPCKPIPRGGELGDKPELGGLIPGLEEPCVPEPSPSPAPIICADGLTDCSGTCKNLTSDVTSCGACGIVCPTNNTCSDGICAERVVQCGTSTRFNGGEGNFTFAVNIGNGGDTFDFNYNADTQPDRFTIFLPNGTQIFEVLAGDASTEPGQPSPGCRCNLCRQQGEASPNGLVTLARPAGVTAVRLVVNGYCSTTGWRFTVGCAAPAPGPITRGASAVGP